MNEIFDRLRGVKPLDLVGRLSAATAKLQRTLAEGQASAGISGREGPVPGLAAEKLSGLLRRFLPDQPAAPLPPDARFRAGSFANQAGSRPYKLYVPTHPRPHPALLVMLHGCTQSPDDFAAGTRMNLAAEKQGFLVLYPAQTASANAQKCWNWFNAADQQRDLGEPSIIAGMTRQVMDEHGIDPRRVFAAGLSAGGAAAAILGQTYPELYAAIGVHSGLPRGAARNMASAFAAMRNGAARVPPDARAAPVRTIVFHGSRDSTVHPGNGAAVAQAAMGDAVWKARTERGQVQGGHDYAVTVHTDKWGRTMLEHWIVENAGHAWSGGSTDGSFTDPKGPDATAKMLKFFLET